MNAASPLLPPVEAFLGWLAVERRMSKHTLDGYRRDLRILRRLRAAATSGSPARRRRPPGRRA